MLTSQKFGSVSILLLFLFGCAPTASSGEQDGGQESLDSVADQPNESLPIDGFGQAMTDGPEESSQPATLSAELLASRLTWFLWHSSATELSIVNQLAFDRSPEHVASVASLMLEDNRARDGMAGFFGWLLRLDDLASQPKSSSGIDPQLRASMRREPIEFANYVIFDDDDRFDTLFLAPYTFMDDRLAAHYGGLATGTSFSKTPYPTTDRVGILGGAGVLTRYAGFDTPTWPARRYGMLADTLTCELYPLGAPAPAIVGTPTDPSQAARGQMIDITKSPACMACHVLVNPLGFAFTSFDSIGRHQTLDVNVAVNTSGSIPSIGGAEPLIFSGQPDLIRQLVALPGARGCFAHRVLAYAVNSTSPGSRLNHNLADLDSVTYSVSLSRVRDKFEASGIIKDLFIEVTRSPSFISVVP